MTIYIYSNETGKQVASHTAADNAACEQWADENYGSNDYHYSYADVPVSNAIEPAEDDEPDYVVTDRDSDGAGSHTFELE